MGFPRLALAAALCAASTSSTALELVAPAAECSLAGPKIVVIGKGAKPAASQGRLKWEAGEVALSAWAGRFYGSATLSPGTYQAQLAFGDEALTLRWVVSPQATTRPYAYHPDVLSEQCRACHDPEAPPPPSRDSGPLCYGCHTKYTARAAIHQPVRMGLCTACHDPHGSVNPAFLRYTAAELCQACHNRPIDKEHEKLKDDASCMECHDPHGSNRAHNLKRR